MSTERVAAFRMFLRQQTEAIFREPTGALRYPFVDPGGPYGNSLWDWDAYWSLKAAVHIKQRGGRNAAAAAFGARVSKHALGVLKNLLDHQAADGSVPILLTGDDPDWFDSTRNPRNNMAKPVLGQLAALNVALGASPASARRWLASLRRFHACYRRRYRHDTGLCVWANDIAIGVDDDPSAWGRPPFSCGNIFLNTMLLADLRACETVALHARAPRVAAGFRAWAIEVAEAIQTYCWDPRDGFYYSVDVHCRQNKVRHRRFGMLNVNLEPFWKCLPLKVMSWTGFLPLWAGLATPEQADRLVREHLLNEARFWTPFGIRTLSADERMYAPGSGRQGNPSNMLGPIWIIPGYLVWEGLRRYGYREAAKALAARLLRTAVQGFERHQCLHEHYSPETGEAQVAPGFVSWNLLLAIMLDDVYPA